VSEPAELRVGVERLASGGEGVARAPDGRVVFVPATAPGDEARVRVVEEHPRWLRAELVAVETPGPGRVEPRCELVGRCGGCAWQHLAYETQRAAKASILRDALERIGRLAVPGEIEVVASPPFGYRGRARIGTARGVVGYRRLRSHSLEPTSRCPVLTPALEEALAKLAAAPPEKSGEIELAGGDDGSVRAWGPGGLLLGRAELRVEAGDRSIQVSPGVFFQGNQRLRGALLAGVLEAAGRGGRAVELCAGAGFFTLPLAERFGEVLAVESSPPAVRDLRRNVEANGAANVAIECAPLERLLAEDGLRAFAPEVVVVDPPRTGLGAKVAEGIAALGAGRVVYVSCAPPTLARDLAVLTAAGLRLDAVRGFDLFPQTPHVEAIAVLRR
jgi:23S rRNA (uracil1939-C5)-methyltransferase